MENQAKQSNTWWKKNKPVLIIAAAIVIAIIVFALTVYWFGWEWTGFNGGASKITKTPQGTNTEYSPGKTFWDWMQLLLVPIMLAIGGFWLNQIQKQREQDAAGESENLERKSREDNQREAALQVYLDRMSELLLEKNLRASEIESEVRNIARVRTLTVLARLDSRRKKTVLQFLYRSHLINKDNFIISLSGADIGQSDLQWMLLENARFNGAFGRKADLRWANLKGADFSGAFFPEANFGEANLKGAIMYNADLEAANLKGAIGITAEELNKAKSLHNATMPDGSIHS